MISSDHFLSGMSIMTVADRYNSSSLKT